MSLLSLPVDLVTEICANWLKILDVAVLDSACCSHAVRERFLAAAFSDRHCRKDYERLIPKYYDGINTWIVHRKATVPGLYITESVYSEVAVDYIQSHGKLLKFIQFTKETHEGHRMEALVLSIAEHCNNICRLDTGTCLSSDSFVQIVRGCRLLENVDIGEGQISNSAISELSSLPHLKSLCMWYREAEGLYITCPTLETMLLRTSGSAMVGDSFGIPLAQSCPRLKVLRAEASCITDATIDAIAANCKVLQTFGVASEDISGEALERLTASCPICWLGFHITQAMEDMDFGAVLKNIPGLYMLCIYNEYADEWDDWLTAVADQCPKLGSLVLGGWYIGETVDGFADLAERCPGLKHLSIDAEDLAGEEFCNALSRCKNMVAISLRQGVTDGVLRALAACPRLDSVQLVDDSQCIAEDCIVALAEGCPALECLTLPEKAEITMNVLQALSRCCPALRYLACVLPDELQECTEEIEDLLPDCEFKWDGNEEED